MKTIIKALLDHTRYRIVRRDAQNRFQAIDDTLWKMKKRGFDPEVVIDGGAHLGSFTLMARNIFPAAEYHLIEPQAACLPQLRALCEREHFILHEYALASEPMQLHMSVDINPNTGAHVVDNRSSSTIVEATSLDNLFGSTLDGRRVLLKLDLQGYELFALNGANRILQSVESILTEVSFYSQAYEPPINKLIDFLDEHDFELYDIASITGRARDDRARQGDFVFAKKNSVLALDGGWS
jgi:FkbM family methyltransferase